MPDVLWDADYALEDDCLFGREDEELLTHEDPEEAADAVLDDAHPETPDEIRVFAYRRMETSAAWADQIAERLLEQWVECWIEAFGNPDHVDHTDEDAGIQDTSKQVMQALCRKMAEDSKPYSYDPTGLVIVYDSRWIKKTLEEINSE